MADGPHWLPYVSPLLIIYVDDENEAKHIRPYTVFDWLYFEYEYKYRTRQFNNRHGSI